MLLSTEEENMMDTLHAPACMRMLLLTTTENFLCDMADMCRNEMAVLLTDF